MINSFLTPTVRAACKRRQVMESLTGSLYAGMEKYVDSSGGKGDKVLWEHRDQGETFLFLALTNAR